jgi:hypothetical protein
MKDLETFQLYLLSGMRCRPLVERSLQALQASRADLAASGQRMAALGFDTPGHGVDLYRAVLGPPVAVGAPDHLGPTSPFHGSQELRFRLPLWPALDLVVNAHPAGYAWGRGFDRRRDRPQPPPLHSVADLQPWTFVIEEVTRRFGTPHREDAWSDYEDLRYSVPQAAGGAARAHLLRFDHRLLQGVTPWEG